MQCVAVWWSVLQCDAVCCSVMQCVAVSQVDALVWYCQGILSLHVQNAISMCMWHKLTEFCDSAKVTKWARACRECKVCNCLHMYIYSRTVTNYARRRSKTNVSATKYENSPTFCPAVSSPQLNRWARVSVQKFNKLQRCAQYCKTLQHTPSWRPPYH